VNESYVIPSLDEDVILTGKAIVERGVDAVSGSQRRCGPSLAIGEETDQL